MSDVVVTARWRQGLVFEVVGKAGVPVTIDGDTKVAPSPVETLLIALVSCMASDVVDIIGKMRVPLEALSVHAEGDRASQPPRRYRAIRLIFHAAGVPADDGAKLQRAVDLSRDTYCSVLHTLQPDLDLTIRVETG